MKLELLALTPSQQAEVGELDTALVGAWLSALDHLDASIRSPTGWFLSGVRSGNNPGFVPDAVQAQAERQAERYIRRVGYLHQTEDELRDELVSRRWPVGERLVELWRSVRPLGEQVEAEQLERAERWRRAQAKLNAPADYESAGSLKDGAITALAAHARTVRVQSEPLEPTLDADADADADIPW